MSNTFRAGLIRPELFLGVVSSVTAANVAVNLAHAGQPSGHHYTGNRYGRGEVQEFVLIEGQRSLLLGQVVKIGLRESERRQITPTYSGKPDLDTIGQVRLLGTVSMDSLLVTAGINMYPRVGDRIYGAPVEFIARLPALMETRKAEHKVTLNLGTTGAEGTRFDVHVTPENLFGRHCAILGATGGGKSWTAARIMEQAITHKAKVVLIDATGEYRTLTNEKALHYHLGTPVDEADESTELSFPPESFHESDFMAMFQPSGRSQGPKFREALRSLRLAGHHSDKFPMGYVPKIGQARAPIERLLSDPKIASEIDDPTTSFDVSLLTEQIRQECVWPRNGRWQQSDSEYSFCLPLVTRINSILSSSAFACVFQKKDLPSVTDRLEAFLGSEKRLMRICLSGLHHEFNAREIIANAIARHLLHLARNGRFRNRPTLVVLDEAHHFLGKHIGSDEFATKLDAFELIAREGRKYGLTICLASQRPRDITEDVLSQVGTLVVHRLTNDYDRTVVERASSEMDQDSMAFLPNLQPGEAVIVGTDFPIPLSVQMHAPLYKPDSKGPDYQKHWSPDRKEKRVSQGRGEGEALPVYLNGDYE